MVTRTRKSYRIINVDWTKSTKEADVSATKMFRRKWDWVVSVRAYIANITIKKKYIKL